MRDSKPTLLIISFSDIASDARVMKQVNLFDDQYQVTTCGFGGAPTDEVEHLRISPDVSRISEYIDAVLMRMRWYSLAYRIHPRAREARRQLRGRRFDAVFANDTDTLGVASCVTDTKQIHADLHEYFPGLHDQIPAWVQLRRPYQLWLLRRFGGRVGSVTTVSEAIAKRYTAEFGFSCEVVRNAAPFARLKPSLVTRPIRLVHSGVAHPNRHIEVMMKAVVESTADITLDLYLTGAESKYGHTLRELADHLGDRVTVHPPVPYSALVNTLNLYDVGLFILPNTNTNYELALPNKFFDFVQARLGIVVSPVLDMAKLLNQYQLGAVTSGYDQESTVKVLDEMTPELVTIWKQNSSEAAFALSAESQQIVWQHAVAQRIDSA